MHLLLLALLGVAPSVTTLVLGGAIVAGVLSDITTGLLPFTSCSSLTSDEVLLTKTV